MKPFAIIYVIETNYEGRVITLGASLDKEAIEKKLAEIKETHPRRASKYWTSEYCLTDTYTDFDMF